MSSLKAAVLGVGYLGRFHAQKWKSLTDVSLVGVYDVSKSHSEQVAKELDVRSFDSVDEILREVDVVSVAASTSSHYELTKKALQAGCHVFVEKPITETISQAQELLDFAQKKNLNLGVGHIERFNPAYTILRSKIKNPLFLRFERLTPFKARGTDVSVVHDLMIHDIDLMCDLFGEEPKEISAGGQRFATDKYDEATAFFKFSGDRKASILVSRVSQVASRTLRAFTKEQIWNADLGQSRLELVSKKGTSDLGVESLSIEKQDPLMLEILSFADSVRKKQSPFVDGSQGLRALQIAEKVMSALEK